MENETKLSDAGFLALFIIGIIMVLLWITDTDITHNPNARKANGVFFETNSGQIIITEDSHIWNVYDLNYKNGQRLRVTFDNQNTILCKEDNIITDIKKDIFATGKMYNVVRRANDGKPFYIDIYQVREIIFPEDAESGKNTIKYFFEDDDIGFIAKYGYCYSGY